MKILITIAVALATIVAAQAGPGKYADISRDSRQITNEAYQVIQSKISQHR